MTPLTTAQSAALAHVRAAGLTAPLTDQAPGQALLLRDHARITLNFHPDRLLAAGLTIAESLAREGRYRNQYETGLSNGSRTAFPGGLRDDWERSLFGGAYHAVGVQAADRPKYGALNFRGHPDGAAPRFGSCHVRLRPAVNARATFCCGDSHLGPARIGTIDALGQVLTGLWDEDPQTAEVIEKLPYAPLYDELPGRSLDSYVEAQVHGGIDLSADAEALVVDPSFRETETGSLLADTARQAGIGLEWHTGFVLAPGEVDAEFRGPAMVPLAALVGRSHSLEGTLDAAAVGRAASHAVRDPSAWSRWGTQDETLQYLKQLWHVLVRYGRPY